MTSAAIIIFIVFDLQSELLGCVVGCLTYMLSGSSTLNETAKRTALGLPAPLGPSVMQRVESAVRYFNSAQNTMLVEIKINTDGFLIVGTLPDNTSFTAGELLVFKSYYVHHYFVNEKRNFRPVFKDAMPSLQAIKSLP